MNKPLGDDELNRLLGQVSAMTAAEPPERLRKKLDKMIASQRFWSRWEKGFMAAMLCSLFIGLVALQHILIQMFPNGFFALAAAMLGSIISRAVAVMPVHFMPLQLAWLSAGAAALYAMFPEPIEDLMT